jgi:peptidoglycan/LPS O-acetylase OafA/YrhL
MVQLNILVALTQDGRLSLASRALRTRLAQWLGKISMGVYLIQWPLIAYTALALYGPRRFEALRNCYGVVGDRQEASDPEHYDECMQAMADAKRFPPWGVVVILPLALLAGEALYRCVEEPARKWLRSRGQPLRAKA